MYPTRKLLTWAVGLEFFYWPNFGNKTRSFLSNDFNKRRLIFVLVLMGFWLSVHFTLFYLLAKQESSRILLFEYGHDYCFTGRDPKACILYIWNIWKRLNNSSRKLCMLKMINSSLADLCYLQLHSSSYGIRSLKFLLIHLTNCFDTRKTEIKVCMELCKAYSMFDQ